LKLWDIESLKFLRTLSGHSAEVSDFVCCAGSTLSCGLDAVRFWDLRSPTGHVLVSEGMSAIALPRSHNPLSFVASSALGDIICFDMVAGRIRYRARAHSKAICNLEYNQDNSSFLSSGIDGTIRLWSTFNSECLSSFSSPSKAKCIFSRFMSGGSVGGLFSDGTFRCWDLNGRLSTTTPIKGLSLGISAKRFAHMGLGRLLIPNSDGGLHMRSIQADGYGWNSIRGHADDVSSVDFATVNTQRLILSTGYGLDCSAVMWRQHCTSTIVSFKEVFPQIVGL